MSVYIEVRTDIETIRDLSSRLWPGDALGEVFTIRPLEGNWTRVRGEHDEVNALLTQALSYGIEAR